MEEGLFSEEFVNKLPELNKFSNPLVVRILKDSAQSNKRLAEELRRWFSNLPPEKRSGMRGRLESQNDTDFYSAFFELALKDYFESAGLTVEYEPELEDKTTPDFRLKSGLQEVYVEVRTIMEPPDEQLHKKRMNDVLVQIDKIKTAYVLSVFFERVPDTSTKPTEMAHEVKKWLNELKLENGARKSNVFAAGGYNLSVSARHVPGFVESTGMVKFDAPPLKFLGASAELMRRGLKNKAGKYKNLQKLKKPYVVAICSTDENFILDDVWIKLAAYGTLDGSVDGRGFFTLTGINPRNSGVSGLLHCKLLQDSNDFSFEIRYYDNPAARAKIPRAFGWHPRRVVQKQNCCWAKLFELFFSIKRLF